ncbi:nucleotide-sugar transporter-domain-containing protein [Chlamydoabsidia padenii]|nr:nucleotide-sugar transporter-domain-containing protein [Chlamydoabsidia padenii]
MVSIDALSVKWISLLVLVIQNSALILIMRYTRASVEKDQLYLASTAVVMSEGLKTVICLLVLSQLVGSLRNLTSFLRREVLHNGSQAIKLGIPAILYLIQNNLQYVAATHLDAATFQVTYQLKILTTAFFSVTLLHRSLSRHQWMALGLLTIGIGLVMMPNDTSWSSLWSSTPSSTPSSEELDRDTLILPDKKNKNDYQGFLAVLMACTLSGLAGVYFEKLLKSAPVLPLHQPSGDNNTYELKKKKDDLDDDLPDHYHQQRQLWLRNMQMSFFSVILGLVFVVGLQDGRQVMENGFFAHYNRWTWCVIVIQALGGLIVALVVKFADNILKGFATSISIIISSLVSVSLFQLSLSFSFVLGASLVIFATYLYSLH